MSANTSIAISITTLFATAAAIVLRKLTRRTVYIGGNYYHNMFHRRLKKLSRSALHQESQLDAADDTQNDGDHEADKNDMDSSDKHRHKRPRST